MSTGPTTSAFPPAGAAGRRRRGTGPEAPADPAGRPRDRAADPDTDPEETARAVCLRLLEARPRSRAELAQALARRGAPAEIAERVLDRFEQVGLVDDAEYARLLTTSRVRERGLARRAVAAELRRRGVGDVEADAALAGLSREDEERAAHRLAVTRQRSLARHEPTVQIRRLAAYLGRRGYPAGLALAAARAAVQAAGDETPEVSEMSEGFEVDEHVDAES